MTFSFCERLTANSLRKNTRKNLQDTTGVVRDEETDRIVEGIVATSRRSYFKLGRGVEIGKANELKVEQVNKMELGSSKGRPSNSKQFQGRHDELRCIGDDRGLRRNELKAWKKRIVVAMLLSVRLCSDSPGYPFDRCRLCGGEPEDEQTWWKGASTSLRLQYHFSGVLHNCSGEMKARGKILGMTTLFSTSGLSVHPEDRDIDAYEIHGAASCKGRSWGVFVETENSGELLRQDEGRWRSRARKVAYLLLMQKSRRSLYGSVEGTRDGWTEYIDMQRKGWVGYMAVREKGGF
ncbi:hypothetical protein BYT27DRAFT_7212423 [Phlegmacium glaucopus]|nr:hypothetical protein BYT27DRAFT_7212423 [Phlegmacium glaucopus]